MNHRKKWAGAAVAAFVALGMLGAAVPASAAESHPSITINGDSVVARTFSSVRIAKYAGVKYDEEARPNPIVTYFDLETQGSNGFKAALITEIVRIQAGGNVADFDGDYDATTTFTIEKLDPMQWVALNWLADTIEGLDDDAWTNPQANNPNLRKLANWLETQTDRFGTQDWNLVTRYSDLGTPGTPGAPGTPVSATIEADEGLNFVWDSTDPDPEDGPFPGKGTNPLAMIVGTKFMVDLGGGGGGGSLTALDLKDQTLGTIIVKGDLVTIDKDIVFPTDADKWNAGDDDLATHSEVEDSSTANVGDTVDFVIRTNVPQYPAPSYANVTFEIVDTFSSGLWPDTENLELFWYDKNSTIDDKWVPEEDPGVEWWTLSVRPDPLVEGQGGSFTVQLKPEGIEALAGKQIQLRYSAEVIDSTMPVFDEDDDDSQIYTKDTNSAQVKFTNMWNTGTSTDPEPDPGTPGGGDDDMTVEDVNYVYTFPFEILKRDINGVHEPINGIEFTLTRESGAMGNLGPLATANGKVEFTGLNANEWYLVNETRMGDSGYSPANIKRTPFAFQIVVDTTIEGGALHPTYVFTEGSESYESFNGWSTLEPFSNGVEGDLANFLLLSDGANDTSETNKAVTVYNAKSADDMPSTGGQILLIVGIAGALGLGAITFGAVGLRKRKALAAAAA